MENPAADAFQVVCSCGKVVAGRRQENHQEFVCPTCGEPVFVLPASPWKKQQPEGQPIRRTYWRRRDWILPLSSMALTLAVLVFLFVRFGGHWLRNGPAPPEPKAPPAERLRTAREHLARGHFRRAREEFDSLLADKVLPAGSAEERAVRQTAAETAILTDLVAESLEEIVASAAGMDEAEWRLEFQARYQGKSLLLDTEFRRDVQGTYSCGYQLFVGKERARFDLANLALLPKLPLANPQRLLLGLRLESIKLEPPGPTWVVRFEPDAAVLLTDAAAQLVCPDLGDEEGQKLLTLQASWLKGQ